jgi:hypothetical protein
VRRRIRHLEHNLRDITARCSVERERLMSLEALVGGKIFILLWFPRSSFRSQQTVPFFRCL